MLDGGTNNRPQYGGMNFAPVADLQNADRSLKGEAASSLSAIFREIAEEIETTTEDVFRDQYEMGKVIGNLRAGKLIMKGDHRGIFFLPPLPNGTDRSNFPRFPQNSETLTSKWLKVKPGLTSRLQGDGYRSAITRETIDLIVRCLLKDNLHDRYEQDEAHEAQDFGTYITQWGYDQRLNQIRQAFPVIQNEDQTISEGYGACHECGFEGKPADFDTGKPQNQCPKCGSYRLTRLVDPQTASVSKVVDFDEIVQGDIYGVIRKFAASRYDPAVFPHESSFFRYRERLPGRLITGIFGEGLDIERTALDDIGLSIMDAMAYRRGNIEELGENDTWGTRSMLSLQDGADMTSYYLKPEWYGHQRLKSPEMTLGGTIPADVPLGEIWPDGVCSVGFSAHRLQVGLFAEKANLASGVFYMQSSSGIGKGVSDAVDVQKDINEIHSMAMSGLKRYAASGVFFNSKAITSQGIKDLFNPRKATPVNMDETGVDDIRKVVGQVQFNPVNEVLPMVAVQLNNLLDLTFMTGDFTQGQVKDVKIDTLGGQELAHAKAEEQKGGIISLKVYHRKICAETIVPLVRQHFVLPKWFAPDDRHGRMKGKYIMGADLPEKVVFDAIPDSEIPLNLWERRNNTQLMVKEAGGLAAFSQTLAMDPKLVGWYAEAHGADLPMLDQGDIRNTCLERVDDIKRWSQIMPDPDSVLERLTKPVQPREAGLLLKAEFLCELLDDDEVAEMNPIGQYALQKLIEIHYVLFGESQLRNQVIEQTVMATLAAREAQIAQAITGPMMAEADEQNKQAMMDQAGMDLTNKIVEEEQADLGHERSLEMEALKIGMGHEAKTAENAEQGKMAAATAKTKAATDLKLAATKAKTTKK